MTSESAGLEILKADTHGRIRMPVAKRQEILAEFQRCGMSGAAFARMVGVKYPTFAGWLQRQRRGVRSGVRAASRSKPSQRIRFVEAQACSPSAVVELELPRGIRLRITQASQISLAAALLRELTAC